jgi:hypothetical protein
MSKEAQNTMTYRGIVRRGIIELEDKVVLPEGTEVEVTVKGWQREELAPSGYPKGSPQAVLAALDAPPRCAPEDVDALLQAIEQGKRPLRFEGIFDRGEAE